MLEHLFGSTTRVRLLQLFFRNPDKHFFVRELSREIGTQLNAVRREIDNLETLGIIEPVPNSEIKKDILNSEKSKFYHLKSDSELYDELSALLAKVQILEEQELINEIKEKSGDLKLFLLSGVFTHDITVSVDMLIVGQVKPVAILRLIKQFEKTLHREIRYTIMTPQEFMERKEIGDKFLYTIFESNHITVLDKFNIED